MSITILTKQNITKRKKILLGGDDTKTYEKPDAKETELFRTKYGNQKI